MKEGFNLEGRNVLITGVSREIGIGTTLARRFAQAGARVVIHGFSHYDLTSGTKTTATKDGTQNIAKQLQEEGYEVYALEQSDLSIASNAEKIIEDAYNILGGLSDLILNHAYSVEDQLGSWSAHHIDMHLQINVRAAMLMIQAFEALENKGNRTITLFSSGQHKHIETNLMAYSISKDATISLCKASAKLLAEQQIRVNCIDPGPTDTGYATKELYEEVANAFPAKRWGTPNDCADIVLFLHSKYGKWISGQLISSHGGFKHLL